MKFYLFLFLLCFSFLSKAQTTKNPRNSTTTIAGRVIDQNGNPLPNVSLQASGGQVSVKSKNPDGDFRIPLLLVSSSQDIALTITLEGYDLPNVIIPNIQIIKAEERENYLLIQLIKKPLPTEKKRIAVLPFCDDTSEKENMPLIDGAFTAEAANALSRIDQENLTAVPHAIVWTAMQRYSLRQGQYCDRDEINKVASAIDANVVLVGMYQKETLGNQTYWRVAASFWDLTAQQSFCRDINEKAETPQLLQEKLYKKILEVLEVPITSEATAIIESQTTQTTQNESSYAHTLNSSQYNTQQEPQKAKEEATKAIKEDEGNYKAYELRGTAEASAGNTEEAQKDYQKAQEKAEKKGIIKRVIDWIKEKASNPTAKITDLPTIKTLPNGIKLIKVEGDTFDMGCNDKRDGDCQSDEKPIHKVTLTDYYIGETEVTNAQYAEFLNKRQPTETELNEWINLEGSYQKEKCRVKKEGSNYVVEKGYENYPVIYVSWYGANEFCTYHKGFLPSEAQWEYAAKGGNKSNGYKYAGSNELNEVAWNGSNSDSKIHEVKTRKPNELGLYDMSGNVWEWCQDWYDSEYYSKSKNLTNPINDSKADYRILRGGSSWNNTVNCRSVYRFNYTPTYWYFYSGFRICLPSI